MLARVSRVRVRVRVEDRVRVRVTGLTFGRPRGQAKAVRRGLSRGKTVTPPLGTRPGDGVAEAVRRRPIRGATEVGRSVGGEAEQ